MDHTVEYTNKTFSWEINCYLTNTEQLDYKKISIQSSYQKLIEFSACKLSHK